MMNVKLNGEAKELPDGVTVTVLLQQLGVQPERVAVEVNLTVLKRAQHPETILKAGDEVEVVQLIGGGSENKPQATSSKLQVFSPESLQLAA